MNNAYLHLLTGPMFASKTTRLIALISKLSVFKKVYVINSSHDNRYIQNSICTHNKNSIKANTLDNLDFTIEELKKIRKNYDVIAIDEAQFFCNLIKFVKKCISLDFHIIVCGLNGNYLQEPMGEITDLIPLCDKIELLKGFCMVCKDGKTEASFTKRLINDNKEIIVGNDNIYQCVCRKHL